MLAVDHATAVRGPAVAPERVGQLEMLEQAFGGQDLQVHHPAGIGIGPDILAAIVAAILITPLAGTDPPDACARGAVEPEPLGLGQVGHDNWAAFYGYDVLLRVLDQLRA